MSLKALPALVGPASPLVDGQLLTWTGLSIAPRRTQTLKLAVAISSCASNTVAFNANITGPNDCVTMAPPSQTTLKRSAKDNPCAPTVGSGHMGFRQEYRAELDRLIALLWFLWKPPSTAARPDGARPADL